MGNNNRFSYFSFCVRVAYALPRSSYRFVNTHGEYIFYHIDAFSSGVGHTLCRLDWFWPEKASTGRDGRHTFESCTGSRSEVLLAFVGLGSTWASANSQPH